MIRSFILGVSAISLLAPAVAAQEASLIRVEPRPYYGATVTIEEGVRVFRPLPKTRTMIINPGQKSPLHITVDGREHARQQVTNNVNVENRIVRRGRFLRIPLNRPAR